MERSHLYGFLASLYRREPSAELLRRIRESGFKTALAEAGADLGKDLLGRPDADLVEALAVEYAALFLGPGKHVSPHASVYLGGEGGGLWESSTIEVKSFIEAAGFDYRSDYHGLPDHISVELEFMASVTQSEAKAHESGDDGAVSRCLEVEEEFLESYLSDWVPEFCRKVGEAAHLSFYREIAKLTAAFVASEREELSRARREGASSKAKT